MTAAESGAAAPRGAQTNGAALQDKVAIVTGGASGLGRATALALAKAGARVVVADLDAQGGREVADMTGGRFRACDVSDLDANRALVDFAQEQYGGVDIALLNAGVATGCGVGDDFDPTRYRRAMGANLDGVVYGTHAVLPALRARGGGSIVATASLAGLAAVPLDPLYAANKHAVVGLARSLGPPSCRTTCASTRSARGSPSRGSSTTCATCSPNRSCRSSRPNSWRRRFCGSSPATARGVLVHPGRPRTGAVPLPQRSRPRQAGPRLRALGGSSRR